jgi:acyl-CoA thioester hydrolase
MLHLTTIKVRWYELDPYHHVNHATYFNYFETARIAALESVGLGLDEMAVGGLHIVVVDAHARFVAPAVGGDEVRIETEVKERRRASSVWHQEMFRDNLLLATLDILGAITDLEGKPTRLPKGFADAFAKL